MNPLKFLKELKKLLQFIKPANTLPVLAKISSNNIPLSAISKRE